MSTHASTIATIATDRADWLAAARIDYIQAWRLIVLRQPVLPVAGYYTSQWFPNTASGWMAAFAAALGLE